MKNFYFPQIFQPIFGDSSLNSLSQWQNTSRRIQTQGELIKEETKTSRNINASKYKFLVHSTKFNSQKQKQQKLLAESIKNQTENFQQKGSDNKIMLDYTDSVYLDDNYQLDKQNKFKIKPFRKFQKQQRSLNVQTQRPALKHWKSNITTQDNMTLNKNINNQSKKLQMKVGNQTSNSNSILSKNKKQQKVNNKKYLSNRLKTENSKNRNNKVKFAVQKEGTLKSIQNTEKSIKSNKKIESKSRKLIQSSKKIKVVKQLSGRRYGMETKQQIQFNLTDQMRKIINSNKFFRLDKRNTSSQEQNLQINSDNTIQTSKKSFKQISIKDINFQKRESRKNFTMHVFKNQQECEKKQKKSYTIWDLKQSTSQEESQSQKQNNGSKKLGENQKKKKKVHFGRTSIEQKTNKSKTKISNGYITTKKSIKLKGIIQRFNGGESSVSIGDILAAQAPQSKKPFRNDKLQIKKASKLRKLDTENVYNELNYFRMRMNISKGVQEEIVNNKPHSQAIVFSVEKVLHQLQNQRIQRTRINNMMIDFGVKITRACVLKQIGVRDKIVNYGG